MEGRGEGYVAPMELVGVAFAWVRDISLLRSWLGVAFVWGEGCDALMELVGVADVWSEEGGGGRKIREGWGRRVWVYIRTPMTKISSVCSVFCFQCLMNWARCFSWSCMDKFWILNNISLNLLVINFLSAGLN